MYSPAVVILHPQAGQVDGNIEFGPANVEQIRQGGGITLPYDSDRFGDPLAHFRVAYGPGWIVDKPEGELVAPMVLRLLPERPWVYWAACVWANVANAEGTVRLVEDRSQVIGGTGGGFMSGADDLVQLNGFNGSKIIGGRRQVQVEAPTLISIGLRVMGQGIGIVVAGASQSRIDVPHP